MQCIERENQNCCSEKRRKYSRRITREFIFRLIIIWRALFRQLFINVMLIRMIPAATITTSSSRVSNTRSRSAYSNRRWTRYKESPRKANAKQQQRANCNTFVSSISLLPLSVFLLFLIYIDNITYGLLTSKQTNMFMFIVGDLF